MIAPMFSAPVRFCFGLFVLGSATTALRAASGAEDPPIIALARAYIGSEAALDGVRSVHYMGTLETTNTQGPKPVPVRGTIDILFAKPVRQRILVRTDQNVTIKVLDDYSGWTRLENPKDPSKFRLSLLNVDDVKSLRASTWENLHFYRGLPGDGGMVIDRGPAVEGGVSCERVDFVHGRGITFIRYFERGSGRLVQTDTGSESIREGGETVVGGIRFPETVFSTTHLPNGKEQQLTIHFERIRVNDPVDPALFQQPNMQYLKAVNDAAAGVVTVPKSK